MLGMMNRAAWVAFCVVVGVPLVLSYGVRWVLFGDRAEMATCDWMDRFRARLFKDGGDK